MALTPLLVRLEPKQIVDLDLIADRLAISRSAAIRMVVALGLDCWEDAELLTPQPDGMAANA